MAQVLVLQAQMLVGTSGAGQRLAGSGRRPHCTSCGIPLKSGVDIGQGLGRRLCIRRDRAPDGDEAPGEQAVFRFLLALVSRAAASC